MNENNGTDLEGLNDRIVMRVYLEAYGSDVEVAAGVSSHGDDSKSLLKPVGGIGKKKLKKKLLLKKLKRRGRGKGKGRLGRSRKV
ncbi:hypothetical protein M5K25_023263 [Dendrobium thyrsiflorum]|uniref:Uncharacterized protein n=1 Tax=Dendrobium thyrsiflorum TaxID=117978 RepID=A0ABD0U7U1_DENTH